MSGEILEGMNSLTDRTRPRPSSGQQTRGRTSLRTPTPEADQTRTLLTVAFRSSGMAILLISAVVVVTLVSASSDLTGTFGAIATTWLAIHQVPVVIDDVQLGVLPLLPTALMMWVVARRCASAATLAETRIAVARLVGAAVAGPLTVTAICLVVVADASAAIPLSSPNALSAFGWVAGIHLVAATVGVVVAHWQIIEPELPRWASAAVRPGAWTTTALLAAGSIAVLCALLISWSTVGDLLARGGGFVGVLGLTVLSLLYLPNLVVGAVAVMTGASADIGEVSTSVFGNIGGDLPPLPVLGAVPAGTGGGFWPVLLVVPVVIGIYLGRDCARRVGGQDGILTAVAAAFMSGTVIALLALASGGELGYFGAVEVTWWAVGFLTFGWLALFGSISALITTWLQHRAVPAPEPTVTAPPAQQAETAESEGDDTNSDTDSDSTDESVDETGSVQESETEETEETEDTDETDEPAESAETEAPELAAEESQAAEVEVDAVTVVEDSAEESATDLPSPVKDPSD